MIRASIFVFLAAALGLAETARADDTPTVSAPLSTSAQLSAQSKPDFAQWLEGVRAEALAKGIGETSVSSALSGLQPIDKVLDFDKRQPEFTLTLDQYLAHTITPQRIADGRKLMAANHKLLTEVANKYGVPAKYFVALWGIESGFGKVMGDYPVVASLATLAYDGRRSQYFRTELLNALQIVDRGATPQQMRGSWAGAMGQCQFMPSTYLKYAQHWDGAGAPDIWHTQADVFASAANYLGSIGWKADETWGRPVKLPPNFNPALVGLSVKKTIAEWAKLGVMNEKGAHLPKSKIEASLVRADPGRDATGTGPPFLVYDNFRAIMTWNRSVFFAVAAGKLADSLASR